MYALYAAPLPGRKRHNTLAFGDLPGFDPADAAGSDQSINVFSMLSAGPACKKGRRAGADIDGGRSGGSDVGVVACDGDGAAIVINLTSAYAAQLNKTGAKNPTVMRSFQLDKSMSRLTVIDSIDRNTGYNVTWAIHTRAKLVTLQGKSAVLEANATHPNRMRMEYAATPPTACGDWQTALVELPDVPMPRFPVRGAQKVWLLCKSSLRNLQVTMQDE
jgi:hypothetical protein